MSSLLTYFVVRLLAAGLETRCMGWLPNGNSQRNAFGPSFGTVCFSGMVMGAVRFVRMVVDSATREDAALGFVNLILQCCANFWLSAVDFVNKFTINFAAITGESYCTSAKMSYEFLKRNLLSAVFVETVSTRTLVGIIFVLSALYAAAVCAILKAVSAVKDLETYLVAGTRERCANRRSTRFVNCSHSVGSAEETPLLVQLQPMYDDSNFFFY